jgi:hypothetical protein
VDHVKGVLGTVGNGYDGVRRARPPAGVGGTLPRMVFPDSVDSVDRVDSAEVVCPVGSGVLNAPSSVGDMTDTGSSLIGDTRRAIALATFFIRARCCFWIALNWRVRSLSSSTSSGDETPCTVSSGLGMTVFEPSLGSSSPLSLMSVSVVSSSCSEGGCEFAGVSSGEVCLGRALLPGRRCSRGRLVVAGDGRGGGRSWVEAVTEPGPFDEVDGLRSLFIVAFPSLSSGDAGGGLEDEVHAGLEEAITFVGP